MSAPIPPAPPPATLPTAPGGAVTVVVAGGARAVEGLSPGALLEVAMQARTRNMVEVTSERGQLTLQLPRDAIKLPGGARMVLQMIQAGGEPIFRIISLNGRPILPGGIPLLPSAGPTVPQGSAQVSPTLPGANAATPSAQQGPVQQGLPGITATVLRPMVPPGGAQAQAQQSAASGGLPLDLAPGTKVLVRIAGTATVPAANPGPAPGAPAPTGTPAAPAMAQAPPATGAAQLGAPAPAAASRPLANAPVPPVPQAPIPAGPQGPASPGPSASATLTGTITAHPPGGQAVVQTPAGTLAVPVPSNLTVGARVVLDVVGPPIPPASGGGNAAPQGLTASGWPALADALATLSRAEPKLAEQLMNSLPQANGRLSINLSVVAAAIRAGDWRQVFNDTIRSGLERAGKGELAARLKGDVEKLSAESTRPLGGGGEWRGMALPFLNNAAIEPIRLYLRRPVEDEGDPSRRRGGGDGQRFVIEITMSKLGRIQFDGMVRRDDKQFDLILRTEAPLPTDMRRDIMQIFTSAGELCGTKGVVVFQPGRFIDLPAMEVLPTALMA